MTPQVHFIRVPIEVWTGRSYRWVDAWVEVRDWNTRIYPPVRTNEAKRIAKSQGRKPVFHNSESDFKKSWVSQ